MNRDTPLNLSGITVDRGVVGRRNRWSWSRKSPLKNARALPDHEVGGAGEIGPDPPTGGRPSGRNRWSLSLSSHPEDARAPPDHVVGVAITAEARGHADVQLAARPELEAPTGKAEARIVLEAVDILNATRRQIDDWSRNCWATASPRSTKK